MALWCICGHLTRDEAFSYVAPDPMRVPSPIRPAVTSRGVDDRAQTKTVACESDGPAQCQRS